MYHIGNFNETTVMMPWMKIYQTGEWENMKYILVMKEDIFVLVMLETSVAANATHVAESLHRWRRNARCSICLGQ